MIFNCYQGDRELVISAASYFAAAQEFFRVAPEPKNTEDIIEVIKTLDGSIKLYKVAPALTVKEYKPC